MATITRSHARAKMQTTSFFHQRQMTICTMHGKERVMKPLVEQHLHLQTEVVTNFNTDVFGTFTGEIERAFDPVTTLRLKIKKALEHSGATLGIGNEGSFGPHPQIPFVTADQEMVMLVDVERDLEIMEVVTTADTNFARAEINSPNDLDAFANEIHFPSHGLILKLIQHGKTSAIEKGITDWNIARQVISKFEEQGGIITAETDMRAHFNPTRMKVIADATEKLMTKILRTCPVCQWPGFGETNVIRGLPCGWCGTPTKKMRALIVRCLHCNYSEEKPADEKKADPQYCDQCNP